MKPPHLRAPPGTPAGGRRGPDPPPPRPHATHSRVRGLEEPRCGPVIAPPPPSGPHLLLGLAAGLVDGILVLFGGLARVLLLLVILGRLREGSGGGTVSSRITAPPQFPLIPPNFPQFPPIPPPRSPCCCCSQDGGGERMRRGGGGREAGAGRGGGGVTSGVTSGSAAAGRRHGDLQRLRGEQGGRPHLPAGPLRAAQRHREDLQLPPRPRPAPARREGRRRLRAARRHPSGSRRARNQWCRGQRALHGRRLFAIGSQLSPEVGSSGIEMLETDTFKLHCFQTLTGIKFVVLADPRQAGIDALLRKIYEIYSDFALKNPFYSLEMPIRCELFDQNLKLALEVAEKAGSFGPGS
uniref:Trafficking protein particle complex subunit 4 n=2 Tax=Neognathae TaxID=8825 RepID=A0A8C3C1S7_CAIMO